MRVKKIATSMLILAASVLALLAIAGILVHTAPFKRFLISRLEQSAQVSLGTKVRIERLEYSILKLSASLSGITIGGKSGPLSALVHIERVEANVKIISFWERKWSVNNLIIDHPVVYVAAENGSPANDSSASKINLQPLQKRVFELAARHVVINRGEIHYGPTATGLSADVRDLTFSATYDQANGRRYFGTLEYRDGRLELAKYNPMPHQLRVEFTATPKQLIISPLVLVIGASQLEMRGSLKNYGSPIIDGDYQARLNGDDLRQMQREMLFPVGTVMLTGNFQYHHAESQSLIQSLKVHGEGRSPVLRIENPDGHADVHDLLFQYVISNGNAIVPTFHASLLGGALDGALTMQDLAQEPRGRLRASVHDTSLAEMEVLLPAKVTNYLRLTGSADAKLEATWTGPLRTMVGSAQVALVGEAVPSPQLSHGQRLPLRASIHARYVGNRRELTLSQSFLQSSRTYLKVNGTIGARSGLQISLRSHDLQELEPIAAIVCKCETRAKSHPVELHGDLLFSGAVRGSLDNPALSGRISGTGIRVKDSSLHTLSAGIEIRPELIVMNDGHIRFEKQGHVRFAGRVGLDHWSYKPTNPLIVVLRASRIPVQDLTQLAGVPKDISGVLDADISLQGSLADPHGYGRVLITDASVVGEPINRAQLRLNASGNRVTGLLDVKLLAGTAHGEVEYFPGQQGYHAVLTVPELELNQLKKIRDQKLKLAGKMSIEAEGTGTLKNPEFVVSLFIPQLQIEEYSVPKLHVNADLHNDLGALKISFGQANTVRAYGTVALKDNYYVNLSFDTGRIPLQPVVAGYVPSLGNHLDGETELQGTVKGPLLDQNALQADLSIPIFTAKYKTIEVRAVNPIKLVYRENALNILRSEIRGTNTDLQVESRIPVRNQEPVSLVLQGRVNLALLQVLEPDLGASGELQFDINSSGTARNSNQLGEIRVVNANLKSAEAPTGLEGVNGVLSVHRNRLDITKLEGYVGGGTVVATGGLALNWQMRFDVTLTGRTIQLVYPRGVRSELDVDATLNGNAEGAYLRGQVNIEQVSFTQDFDLADLAALSEGSASGTTGEYANDTHLQVAIQTPSGLELSGRTLNLRAGANLRLQGTAAHPILLGRVDVLDGDVIFLSNRYEIKGGTVAFSNTTRTEPIVNLTASTRIKEYDINLRLEGPIERMRTNYTSDPSLPPADIISLIAFGRTTQATASNPNGIGLLGADSLLASGISSQLASKVQRFAGISQLTIDPILGTNQENQGARIAIQHSVSSNLFVTYSTDVTSTLNQELRMHYRLSPRWSVVGNWDQNGGFGVHFTVRKEF